MKLAAISLVALALAGCSTTAVDLRRREPTATFQAARPPADVAQCISERISQIGAPSVFQGTSETTVTFTDKGATTLFVTITPTGAVSAWRLHPLVRGMDDVERCVRPPAPQ
jgi:hypothetical protein